jgi:hypothetical protein
MKKILMGLIMFLFLASCATTRPKVEHRYSNITPEKIQNTCDTDNRWWMHLGGFGVVVLQFDNCLGVDKMLVMSAPTPEFSQEIRSTSYKLLGLHYLNFMNKTKPDKIWSLQLIKDFLVPAGGTNETPQWIVIYKINSKPADCSGGTCKKKQ